MLFSLSIPHLQNLSQTLTSLLFPILLEHSSLMSLTPSISNHYVHIYQMPTICQALLLWVSGEHIAREETELLVVNGSTKITLLVPWLCFTCVSPHLVFIPLSESSYLRSQGLELHSENILVTYNSFSFSAWADLPNLSFCLGSLHFWLKSTQFTYISKTSTSCVVFW
jgi:hypothetical protein